VEPGFEFRALLLAQQMLYHLSYTSSPFFSGYFVDEVSNDLPGLASNYDSPHLSFPRS
jgi:hypothetical protein